MTNHLLALGMPLLLLTLAGSSGCEDASEAKENYDTKQACEDYCVKRFNCADVRPDEAQLVGCVNGCRDAIEDDCGNANQNTATNKLDVCNNQACPQFAECVVFVEEPGCFGLVD